MLAAPMPCSSNTSAAAWNSFSRVSSRVGRVLTLDMRGKSITLQLDTVLYRIAQEACHEPARDRPDHGRQFLPRGDEARLPRGSLPVLRTLPRHRSVAARRRYDLVRPGARRGDGHAAPSPAVDC